MSNLRIVVQEQGSQADIVVIQAYGSLDTVGAYTLQKKLNALIRAGIYKFIIDLDQLDYISSAGIGVFPAISGELQIHAGELIFARVPEKIYKLFELVGLITQFTITETVEQALEEFESS